MNVRVNFLQVINTKDRENKSTLLHFLIQYAEKEFPQILSFSDDLVHVDEASRLVHEAKANLFQNLLSFFIFPPFLRMSCDNLQKLLKQMDNSIKNLETDLMNAQRSPPPESDDRRVKS